MEKFTEKLLKILEKDSRYSVADLASMLGESVETVEKTIEKLEKEKIICGYKTIIDWDKVSDVHVTALIELQVKPQKNAGFEEIAETIMQMSEVESVYLMSGSYDLSVTVKGRSFKEVALFVAKRLAVMENIESTATSFVLRRYKEIGVKMIDNESDDRGAFSF
ncbi:MAG: Lrp/AsnC family transcriptional regulator [Clostridia bacterium]|nr:Lrp/AsnC family transcriptional regulator [Clostridia bacterium]